MLSFSPSLLFADSVDGDVCPEGERGEMALDGCDVLKEGDPRMLLLMLASEARRSSLFGPILCLSMNLSSHAVLPDLRKSSSVTPMVLANKCAFSLISSAVTGTPLP